MAIITKPTNVEKSVSSIFSLDKSQLSLIPSVASDAYYSNTSNWKEVVVYYKSNVGNQKEIVRFDASLASPQATFLVSDKAKDVFEVQKIAIIDYDNGFVFVNRSELNTPDFDIYLASTPVENFVVWDSFISGFTLGSQGSISKSGAVSDYGYCPRSSVGFSGNFELTFEALDTDLLEGWCAGVSTSISSNPENGLNQCIFYFSSGFLYVYKQGGFISSPLSLISGNNIFKMTRNSNQMSFFLNGSSISVSSTLLSETVYPEARVGGSVKKSAFI